MTAPSMEAPTMTRHHHHRGPFSRPDRRARAILRRLKAYQPAPVAVAPAPTVAAYMAAAARQVTR